MIGIDINIHTIKNITVLTENINMVLEHFNFCKMEFEKEEKIILFEKNSSAIAVTEIVGEDTACKVIKYNHYLLKCYF